MSCGIWPTGGSSSPNAETLWNTQILFRTDLQVTGDALFPIEQIAVGGVETVRGYRENQLVRDSGVITSLEVRVPLFRNLIWRDTLSLAPFVDVGHVWNSDDRPGFATAPTETLASVGAGLR